MRIMVVEPDDNIRFLLGHYLSEKGHTIISMTHSMGNGERATTWKPNIIFIDYNAIFMDEINSLTDSIKFMGIKSVFITTLNLNLVPHKYKLLKPFLLEDLDKMIEP